MTAIKIWFALATFACSALIFWVEPLVGKQLLPLVGGVPAVWNVCLLFFQLALLAGYATAHGLTRVRDARVQAAVFVILAVVAATLLPVRFDGAPLDASRPVLWLFGQLTVELLLPFVVLSAAAPLLQHWFSRTTASSAGDPYFLYAASNAGSLIALLAFPLLLEPAFRVHAQNSVWSVLFGAAVVLAASTALVSRGTAPRVAAPALVSGVAADTATGADGKPHARDLLRWALYAAVPSSLLMGTTSYITSDIAPVPLLWVVPLALYLVTFILAFGPLRGGMPARFARVPVMAAVAWCTLYRLAPTEPLELLVAVHLIAFVILALGVHVRLAEQRPPASHLTLYYLAISAGGALGGAFNALLAPALFNSYLEYPIAVIAAVWINMPREKDRIHPVKDLLPVAALAVLVAVLLAQRLTNTLAHSLFIVALPVVAAFLLSARRLRFTIALAVVVLSARFDWTLTSNVLHADRNFYGVMRVTTDNEGRYRELRHGNTLHGAMDTQRPGGSEPLSYYWVGSPIAEVLRDAQHRNPEMRVAVVGLGVGALAWYGRPGQEWTFYEINPAVVDLAQDSSVFHFLSNSHAESIDVVLGDARLRLREAPDSSFDVIVLDAFTSDAIPLHILTQEAMALYLSKLRPGGVLAFHVSNRYLNLAPPIAATGLTHGLHTFIQAQQIVGDQAPERVESSDWLVLVRNPADFPPAAAPHWFEVNPTLARPWTDDYSNIWSAFVR